MNPPRLGMPPGCTCGKFGMVFGSSQCPAAEKHVDAPPPNNPVDRALPPQGYYEYAPTKMTQSTMEFRGGRMAP